MPWGWRKEDLMSSRHPAPGAIAGLLFFLSVVVSALAGPPVLSLFRGAEEAAATRLGSAPPGPGVPRSQLAGTEPTEPVLVKVRVGSEAVWSALRSIGAELYLRGDGYAVVKLAPSDIPSLDSFGLRWEPLGVPGRGPLYYLLPGSGSPVIDRDGLRLLDEVERGYIVTAGGEAVARAREAGYLTVPLDRPWPMRAAGFLDLEFVHDSITPNPSFHLLTRTINRDTLTSYVKHLQDFGTRHSDSEEIFEAGNWLVETLGRFGYPDTLFESIQAGKGIAVGKAGNVWASKPGSRRPQFRVLVGGHYDSITNGEFVPPQVEAPGADDNGSGTAATLEIARVLANRELDATVQYVLFSGEEQGLHGSMRFVTQLIQEEVPPEKIFFINMDMIGNSDRLPWRVKIFTNEASLPLAELIAEIARAYTDVEPVMMGNSGRSDHAPFHQAGYPAVFLHENDFSPVYHSRQDLLVHMEMGYMAEVVRIAAAAVLHLATLAGPPSGVVASNSSSGEVLLEWGHSSDADVIGYRVEVVDRGGGVLREFFTKDNSAVLSSEVLEPGARARVRAEDILGEGDYSDMVMLGDGIALEVSASPSPTAGGVRFGVFVPGPGGPVGARVDILDAAGRRVRSIRYDNLDRGSQVLQWDGDLSNGDTAPSGVYFYRLSVDGLGDRSGKLMVIR